MRFSKLLVLLSLLFFAGCGYFEADDDGGDSNSGNGGSGGNGGGGGGAGSSRNNAISVTVGNSSSHTISSSGEHWFKFIGDGNPVIFETRGNVVDTYINVEYTQTYFFGTTDDNSGEGSNALLIFTPVSGETYYVKITARSGTYGSYTFVVE